MKKIIRLTESELTRLVKMIVEDQSEGLKDKCIKEAGTKFVRLTEKNNPCDFPDSSSFAQFIIEKVLSHFEGKECYEHVEDYCWNDMGDMCIMMYDMYCGE